MRNSASRARRGRARFPARLLVGVGAIGLALACGRTASGPGTSLPALDPTDTDPALGYERPPVLHASEVLPPELREGPDHRVEDRVTTDGFHHVFRVESRFGAFEAVGDDLLRVRLKEIAALAVLAERGATAEFAEAVARALASPVVATWNLVRHPVDSIVGVPKGAWRAVRRAAALAEGERSELEDGALTAFIGFESVKRELAHRLGVDPYSSNRVLQRELNRFAWAAYAGGLPARFVPFQRRPERAAAGPASGRERLETLLLHYPPEDLRRLNRIELAVMGVPEDLADTFLGHPWYSPRHETLLVASLAGLDLTTDRSAFLALAVDATSESDALYYQRSGELLQAYHEHGPGLLRIAPVGRATGAVSRDGALILPLVADLAVWSRPFESLARGATEAAESAALDSGVELLVSGRLSAKARRELEARGIRATEQAFEALGAPPTASLRR